MPIYMEISRLYRTVTLVARGEIAADEIRSVVQQLADAHVPEFSKVVDVSSATSELTEEQVQRVAAILRGDPNEKRGPVAFIINPTRDGFAHAFAKVTTGERPISLFQSLHEARDWLAKAHSPRVNLKTTSNHLDSEVPSPWNDPERQGVLFKGQRHREVGLGFRGR
jgi:hypothetical protein